MGRCVTRKLSFIGCNPLVYLILECGKGKGLGRRSSRVNMDSGFIFKSNAWFCKKQDTTQELIVAGSLSFQKAFNAVWHWIQHFLSSAHDRICQQKWSSLFGIVWLNSWLQRRRDRYHYFPIPGGQFAIIWVSSSPKVIADGALAAGHLDRFRGLFVLFIPHPPVHQWPNVGS